MELYAAFGRVYSAWARSRLTFSRAGAAGLRQAIADYVQPGNRTALPFFLGLLAERQADAQDIGSAIATINEALAWASETGERLADPFLHRLRGDILLKRDPSNPASTEEAYQIAIAIAKEQGARSYSLQAALVLAKLYQSTGRPVEAHDILAPALEGFARTAEMPEIAEAQALLTALAETGEVKHAAATRQRRLQLQTRYSQALMWSRGAASEEAKAAFAHAQELAKGVDNAGERFDAYYGLFAGSLLCGELPSARETAEAFLRETENEARRTEAAAARRCLGLACVLQGDLAVARAHFEQALKIFDPERDREAKFRFGMDTRVGATAFLAITNWLLGEAGPAGTLMEEAIACAVESAHPTTMANVYLCLALFNALRVDADAAQRATESVLEVSRAHGLGVYLAAGALASSWARARLGDRAGMMELRQALAAYADRGNKMLAPFFHGRLAEFEAEEQDAEGALARIDEGLALAEQTGEHWTVAFLHRIRGDILLKADPEHPARAEDAYLAAIAVAREQGARSFGLQAALKLAKLYRSTGRPIDAHDALAPAVEGFSPTLEMPEIAETQALLERLANGERAIVSKGQAIKG
jgi:adenylate cyclase